MRAHYEGEVPLRVLWRSRLGADAARRRVREERLQVKVVTERAEALDWRDWAEVLVDGSPDAHQLDGRELQHVVVPYAGVSAALREAVLARPHLRLWNSHFNAPFVGQHAVALLLDCCNRISEGDRALRRGDWSPRYDETFSSMQLDDKVALLLGYGAIGKELEKRLRALGMKVAVYRRRPAGSSGDGPAEYGPDRLHEALASADVVIASLPNTPSTRGLLDGAAFAAMRPGSVLVNVGRGEVVDADALYLALVEGRLRGAGLDVWWHYPEGPEARSSTLPADPPLHELPNVVMSPHRANQVDGWEESAFLDVMETLRTLAGGGSRNPVDPRQGY